MPFTTRVIAAFADHKGSPFFFEAISGAGSVIKPGHLLKVKQNQSTAVGATTDTAGYAVGATSITLAMAGTGTIVSGDEIIFADDNQRYIIEVGDADVSGGGTITIAAPGLLIAIPAATTAITFEQSIGKVRKHNVDLGTAEKIIADIDPTVGGTVETVYAAGSTVRVGSYQTGQEVFIRLAAASVKITIGDALGSAGIMGNDRSGTVTVFVPSTSEIQNSIIGYARETIDNSGNSTEAFVLVRIA